MTIKLTITRDKRAHRSMRYCVDDPKVPGTPFVGYGATIPEAIGNWLVGNADRHNIRLSKVQEKHK